MRTVMRTAGPGWGAGIREINDLNESWLGRQDSNLGMPVPKTGALPLGDAPTAHVTERSAG